jgi:hypothetical protein
MNEYGFNRLPVIVFSAVLAVSSFGFASPASGLGAAQSLASLKIGQSMKLKGQRKVFDARVNQLQDVRNNLFPRLELSETKLDSLDKEFTKKAKRDSLYKTLKKMRTGLSEERGVLMADLDEISTWIDSVESPTQRDVDKVSRETTAISSAAYGLKGGYAQLESEYMQLQYRTRWFGGPILRR